MDNNPFHLERVKITSLTFNEANDHINYWSEKAEDERLKAACFISIQIFALPRK